jgi:transposase-like protein
MGWNICHTAARFGIARNTVYARLDDAQQQAEVARQDAALRAAEAGIAEAQANVRRAQSTLDDLLAGLRPAEIEQLRERVKSAGATRVLAERELSRPSRDADGVVPPLAHG